MLRVLFSGRFDFWGIAIVAVLYGIKNCDTVKKARRWLDQHQVGYSFHDFRQDGLEPTLVQSWVDALGWEALVNKRSTTWRQLDPELRETLNDQTTPGVLLEHPTLIKRPVLDIDGQLQLGFKAEQYETLFKKS